ncbi:MAG: MBL fold metallo-hydrolase [Asticcacaulis sp.]|uniref:MBL fold metallo-hydrolase n=1 Tax=Asticcacaulis sp. TaxID=1872648 RepID=UPI0039E71B2C
MMMVLAGALGAKNVCAEAPAAPMSWTTLGTAGGPVIRTDRSQPANLLTVGNDLWLVDCGDGCLERLSGAGAQPARVSAVFISHLHMDHIGGLQGLIGVRWMQNATGALTIYGPPGIEQVVEGIVQSLAPSTRIGFGEGGALPKDTVTVVVLKGGSDLTVDGTRIRVVQNSHFDTDVGKPADNGTQSLSYRFDRGGQGIGYTGDTGPSIAVTDLFKGSDLIVSEVIDLPGVVAKIEGPASTTPPQFRAGLIAHLKSQHLTPEEAGQMAAAAGARTLVLTHLSIIGKTDDLAPKLTSEAHNSFKGTVVVAHDLDTFQPAK